MANPEHLEILKQGVEVWNRWRMRNLTVWPDFTEANLKGLNFSGAQLRSTNFCKADLREANLSKSNLFDSDFSYAQLDWADLSQAIFSSATLKAASLSFAILRGVDFHSTNLSDANLREANLSQANLSGALLSRAVLDGVDFSDAKLNDAHLSGANLIRANLSSQNLRGLDLKGANLCQADLVGAILTRANLSGANLSGAKLNAADLSRANLKGADFNSVTIGWTVFGNNDLSVVKHLNTVNHIGPSTVGIDTLYESKGNIPETFLRGCGVPDTFITFARSLVGAAIDYDSAFISYSSRNHDFAERLYADLQSNGVRCWFAPEDIKIGDPFRQRIEEAIRIHDKLLLILSEDSMASAWVADEVEAAFERERRENRLVFFPVRIDDAIEQSTTAWAASLRRSRHIGDFSKWKDHDSYRKAFDRLLRDLKSESKA